LLAKKKKLLRTEVLARTKQTCQRRRNINDQCRNRNVASDDTTFLDG
jgi:hypothetical protein